VRSYVKRAVPSPITKVSPSVALEQRRGARDVASLRSDNERREAATFRQRIWISTTLEQGSKDRCSAHLCSHVQRRRTARDKNTRNGVHVRRVRDERTRASCGATHHARHFRSTRRDGVERCFAARISRVWRRATRAKEDRDDSIMTLRCGGK
jgi:hypothetical protein